MAGAYSRFLALLLPTPTSTPTPHQDGMLVHRLPPAVCRRYPFIYLGKERVTTWGKGHCLRKQRNERGFNPDLQIWSSRYQPLGHQGGL